MKLLGSFNLNYLNTNNKESLDTLLTTYNLDVTNKTIPTHSKSLISCIITDLSLVDPTKKSTLLTTPIKTDHLANIFITEIEMCGKKLLSSAKYMMKNNYSEK